MVLTSWLKPHCVYGAYVVAEATTYKDSRILAHTLKPYPDEKRQVAHTDS